MRSLDRSGVRFEIVRIQPHEPEIPSPLEGVPPADGIPQKAWKGNGEGESPLCEERLLSVYGFGKLYEGLEVRMRGDFQYANAATAIGIAGALQSKGFDIPESAIRSGLESAYLPGRLEVLRKDPTLLIDGAHNLEGARNLAKALRNLFTFDNLVLVMGMASGHSVEDVVGTLAPLAARFVATAPDNPRAASAASVAQVARAHCPEVTQVEPVAEAVRRALQGAGEKDLVCVTGSFYTIGEVPRSMDEF